MNGLPGEHDADTPPSPTAFAAALVAVCAAALAVVWLPDLPPGTDTPTHLLFAARIAAGDAGGDWLTWHLPATAQGFVLLTAAFACVTPLAVAAKLALTVTVGATTAAAWWLGRAFERVPLGTLLAPAAALGFGYAMGFLNFQLAVAGGLTVLAAGVRAARDGGGARWALTGALLTATAWLHVIVAGMFGVQLALTALVCAPREHRARRLGALAAAAAPAALYSLFVVARVAGIESADPAADGVGARGVPFADTLLNIARTSYGPYASLAWTAVAATLVGAVLAARHTDGRRLLVPLTLAGWGLAYLIVPFHLTGWAYAAPRLLVMALFVPAALAAAGPRPVWTLGGLTAAGLVTLISTLGTAVPLGDVVDGQARAVSASAPAGNTLGLRLRGGEDPAWPYIQPLLHVDDYALLSGGASAAQAHNNPWMHAVLHGPAATADFSTTPAEFIYRALDCSTNPACEHERAVLEDRVAVAGLRYDSVVVVAQDVEFAGTLADRGYEQAAISRWSPRPRTITLDVTFPDTTDPFPIVARAGYPETIGWFAGLRIPPGQRGRTERMPIGPVPAGQLRLQLGVEQPDGSVTPFFDVTLDVPTDEDPVLTVAPGT